MDDATNQQILALQERLHAGELTPEAYIDAVNLLVDPSRISEYAPNSYVPEPFDEDDDTDADTDGSTSGALPPVPDGLTSVYGTREPAPSGSSTPSSVAVIVAVLVVFALSVFFIATVWVMLLAAVLD